jgi:hypothetical protein
VYDDDVLNDDLREKIQDCGWKIKVEQEKMEYCRRTSMQMTRTISR